MTKTAQAKQNKNTQAELDKITGEILKAARVKKGHPAFDLLCELTEELATVARRMGMDDMVLELWDGEEMTEENLAFAMENNGVADPRRH